MIQFIRTLRRESNTFSSFKKSNVTMDYTIKLATCLIEMPAMHDVRSRHFDMATVEASDFVLRMKWWIFNNFMHPSMTFTNRKTTKELSTTCRCNFMTLRVLMTLRENFCIGNEAQFNKKSSEFLKLSNARSSPITHHMQD